MDVMRSMDYVPFTKYYDCSRKSREEGYWPWDKKTVYYYN